LCATLAGSQTFVTFVFFCGNKLLLEEARKAMQKRFAAPDWEFAPGTPMMSRDERNARG
jgi:hypothetical protein